MTTGVERILTLTFGSGGNEANHLGYGWSGDEPGSRWMIGPRSEFWLEHPGQGHDLILELEAGTVTNPFSSTGQRLLIGVRSHGIAQISVEKAGGTLGFHIPARVVESPGPVRLLFVHPDFMRPLDVGAGGDTRELSISLRDLRLYRVLSRPDSQTAVAPPPDQMVMRFESLGDNCEFGLVQRQLGAEPLGLLRFAFIGLPMLLRGLRSGFAGLGDPDTIEVTAEGKDREFVVRESVYGMTYHTFLYEDRIALETVRQQQAARLNFLRRKLMEDLAEGEKIFVIKRTPGLRPEEVLPLYTQLNELGRNWLLWMLPEDGAHKAGTVETLLPGLLRGYVDRFAPHENAHDLSMAHWTSVCEAAWRMVGGATRG